MNNLTTSYYGIQPFKWYFELQTQGILLASVPRVYPAPARKVTFRGLDTVVHTRPGSYYYKDLLAFGIGLVFDCFNLPFATRPSFWKLGTAHKYS